MENIKQQISDLKYQTGFIINQIKQLQQQVNKPKIEVGKVYKEKDKNKLLFLVIENKKGTLTGFGFNRFGEFAPSIRRMDNEDWQEATKEEWETALSKHADKIYEGVEKVDRSGCLGFPEPYRDATGFLATSGNIFSEMGFRYNGIYVMDKHGVWAKPVIESKPELDYDIEIHGESFKKLVTKGSVYEMPSGKYKLVKVG